MSESTEAEADEKMVLVVATAMVDSALAHGKTDVFVQARAAIAAYRDAEIERLTALCATLRQQAEIHAIEARGANASLAECYRAVTGGTGEPGNWHGARPVVDEITDLRAKLEAAERDAERYRKWKWWFREGEVGLWNAICEANSDAEHDAAIDAARGGER